MKKVFNVTFDGVSLDVADAALDTMDAVERKKKMNALFSAYIRDTYKESSFFKRQLDAKGIDPTKVTCPEDLGDIFLGKNTLNTISADDLLPDKYKDSFDTGLGEMDDPDRIGKTFSSSGSTGRAAEVYYTQEDWENTLAVIRRGMRHVSLEMYSRMWNGFHQGHVAGKVFEDAYNRAGSLVKNRHFNSKDDEDSLNQIARDKSNCLCLPADSGKVSKGGDLKHMLIADKENVIGKQIKTIITTGGPRSEALVAQVHQRNTLAGVDFKTQFVDYAGCAEVLPTVAECEANDGMHFLEGITYVEVIHPETKKHVKNGERGILIYTAFKKGSRFIRYIVGDEATFIDEPCSCGRTTPRIKDLKRIMDIQRFEEGCGVWK